MSVVKPLFDLSTAPLRLGFRIAQGLLAGRSDGDAGSASAEPERPFSSEPPRTATRAGSSRTRRASGQASRRRSAAKPIDDVTLARKVETEIFRDRKVPKGKIDVNAADGVVWLRGEAKTPEMIKALERQALDIPEVKKVENLLHLPKTPAPSRTDTPPTQRKTRRSKTSPRERKVTRGKVTAERKVSGAEQSPAEAAAEGSGRKAAPLGSSRGGSEGGRRGGGAPRPRGRNGNARG